MQEIPGVRSKLLWGAGGWMRWGVAVGDAGSGVVGSGVIKESQQKLLKRGVNNGRNCS